MSALTMETLLEAKRKLGTLRPCQDMITSAADEKHIKREVRQMTRPEVDVQIMGIRVISLPFLPPGDFYMVTPEYTEAIIEHQDAIERAMKHGLTFEQAVNIAINLSKMKWNPWNNCGGVK